MAFWYVTKRSSPTPEHTEERGEEKGNTGRGRKENTFSSYLK